MNKLTAEQRQLIEDHLYLAGYMARKFTYTTYLEYEELKSMCLEGLCHAALVFDSSKGKFSTLACTVMKRLVFNQLRKHKQYLNYKDIRHISSITDNLISIESIDLQNTLSLVLRNFEGTQREKAAAITLIRNPDLTQNEIALKVGISQKTVSNAIVKLREQLQYAIKGCEYI